MFKPDITIQGPVSKAELARRLGSAGVTGFDFSVIPDGDVITSVSAHWDGEEWQVAVAHNSPGSGG